MNSVIFLSASIPDPNRDKVYFETADTLAIRDAVKALTTVIVYHSLLVWGGHPAITPLVKLVLQALAPSANEQVLLYQSLYFEDKFPRDNAFFKNIRYVEKRKDAKDSIDELRSRMLYKDGHKFTAGVFIGGMEGVIEEFNLFRKHHPKASAIPVASTGGAAKIIYENLKLNDPRLVNDYAYMNLFKSMEL